MSPPEPARAFAILPAAGSSRRMGRPKLLLPWDKGTLIESLLCAWRQSGVSALVLVAAPGADQIAQIGRDTGAHVIQPAVCPPDMKASVRLGLDYVEHTFAPAAHEAWLTAPADMPLLKTATIDQVLAAWRQAPSEVARQSVFIACHAGRQGHPVLFPWLLKNEILALGDGEGLDTVVRRHRRQFVAVHDAGCLADLDTPDDYERLRNQRI